MRTSKRQQKSQSLPYPTKQEVPVSSNSFYDLGGVEILSMAQDEISNLWKIYLSTTEHYLVSREFDRSVGLYANAPDEIVRLGLMDFSESLIGSEFSLWKVMDLFIDRCFSESAFDGYTENAVWLSIDHPSYTEVEEIIGTYNSRLKWFAPETEIGSLINKAMFKSLIGDDRKNLIRELKSAFAENKILTIFMNPDSVSGKLVMDSEFEEMPIFVGEFDDNGVFRKFNYLRR